MSYTHYAYDQLRNAGLEQCFHGMFCTTRSSAQRAPKIPQVCKLVPSSNGLMLHYTTIKHDVFSVVYCEQLHW